MLLLIHLSMFGLYLVSMRPIPTVGADNTGDTSDKANYKSISLATIIVKFLNTNLDVLLGKCLQAQYA